jgi:hypothetical protein
MSAIMFPNKPMWKLSTWLGGVAIFHNARIGLTPSKSFKHITRAPHIAGHPVRASISGASLSGN